MATEAMEMTRPKAKPAAAGKVMVLTPTDPHGAGIGSLFLRDAIASIPETELTFCLQPPFLSGSGQRSRLGQLCHSAFVRSGWLQGARLAHFRRKELKASTEAAATQADRDGAACIWTQAFSPETIAVAANLAAAGRDIRVTVMDAPAYLADNLRLPLAARQTLFADFDILMRRATRVSVVSEAMRRDHISRFGVRPEIIRHGVNLERPLQRRRSGETINIIFAGSLYAKAEWNAFVAALDAIDWTLDDRPLRMFFMGRFPAAGAIRPRQLTLLGQQPLEQALETMSEMDIGYLPYWLGREHAPAARTSFPGKMSAYAGAGLAVFHHGPTYAEATVFLTRHRFGVSCATRDADEIVERLRALVALKDAPQCQSARDDAFASELSGQAMAARLGRLLSLNARQR